eukprot:gene21169-biopygen14713
MTSREGCQPHQSGACTALLCPIRAGVVCRAITAGDGAPTYFPGSLVIRDGAAVDALELEVRRSQGQAEQRVSMRIRTLHV